MSDEYFDSDSMEITTKSAALGNYRFSPDKVNHYYCNNCGIYPFHDAVEDPGKYRVNLGCIDAIDLESLSISFFDGKASWRIL